MSNSNNTNNQAANLNPKNVPSQLAQISAEIVEKLVGTGANMSTTITFDDLEVDVPHAKGPDGSDIGSAKWVINGKIMWTTTVSNKE
ncbi:MAG TPA: hypothetical protein VH500_01730 [Nitrososphaeraceae archaeon]|jgi:hypothetical protein